MEKNIFIILVLGLYANASPTKNQFNRQEAPRVIVIGGGVAGITTASNLYNEGFNVTLLEASDRVGGRTYTWKTSEGQHLEIGGEWVHGEIGNSIFELVSPLGLLHPTKSILEFGNQFGLPTGQVLNASLSSRLEELRDYIWFDPEAWGEVLEEEVSMGEFARFILERFNQVYPINDDPIFLEAVYDWAHRVTNAEESAFNWFIMSSSDEGEQYVTLEGHPNIPWNPPYSFSSLHQLILTGNVTEDGQYEVPDWIQFNKRVNKIEYSTQQDSVQVTTEDGSVYSAEHIVWTPSLGVLKANHETIFTPNLSQKRNLAIENLGFGSVSKIYYQFESPWWPENWEGIFLLWDDHEYTNSSLQYWRDDITKEELMIEYNGLPLWCRSILSIFTVDSGSGENWARMWISGRPSLFLDEMDPEYIQEHFMKIVHMFLDQQFDNIAEPISSLKSNWGTNPDFLGAYSSRTMASEEKDVWARDLSIPILHLITGQPLICFAGEATHPLFYSTVHGAYDSGIREYQRIRDWYTY